MMFRQQARINRRTKRLRLLKKKKNVPSANEPNRNTRTINYQNNLIDLQVI